MTNKIRRAILLFHISNGLSILLTGFITFMIMSKSAAGLRAVILEDTTWVLGAALVAAMPSVFARKMAPKIKNPLFATTILIVLNVISLGAFLAGVALLAKDSNFIYLSVVGVIIGMIAWLISVFNSRQAPLNSGQTSNDHVLDDFDIENSEKTHDPEE